MTQPPMAAPPVLTDTQYGLNLNEGKQIARRFARWVVTLMWLVTTLIFILYFSATLWQEKHPDQQVGPAVFFGVLEFPENIRQANLPGVLGEPAMWLAVTWGGLLFMYFWIIHRMCRRLQTYCLIMGPTALTGRIDGMPDMTIPYHEIKSIQVTALGDLFVESHDHTRIITIRYYLNDIAQVRTRLEAWCSITTKVETANGIFDYALALSLPVTLLLMVLFVCWPHRYLVYPLPPLFIGLCIWHSRKQRKELIRHFGEVPKHIKQGNRLYIYFITLLWVAALLKLWGYFSS